MMYKNAAKGVSEYKVYKKYIGNSKGSKIDKSNIYTVPNNIASESCKKEIEESYSANQELNLEQKRIAQWLEKLKFRKQVVGGINEYDVWKKMIELNAMYEQALKAERMRCDIIIDHYKNLISTKEVDQEREDSI